MKYQLGSKFAKKLDKEDELSKYREQFRFPSENCIYLCGNSLGLQPRSVRHTIREELDSWGDNAVEGHFKGTKWVSYHREIGKMMAKLVGAKPSEVVMMNSLTVNLHLLMISFYRPTAKRHKILVENRCFPSDYYAVKSQIEFHGYNAEESIIHFSPAKGREYCTKADFKKVLEEQGDEIALIVLGGVNYYSGQVFEMEEFAKYAQEKGCTIGLDLAHGVGNVELQLHDWGIDFAVWCSYKYLNAGPGAVGGAFIHEKHASRFDLPRFTGWWSYDEETRFLMDKSLNLTPGAEGWQVSNPPIFSLAPIRDALKIFNEVGMKKIIRKRTKMTGYLEFLLQELRKGEITISPPEKMRGAQISICIKQRGREVYSLLKKNGVICDWREPDVIRIAPIALYNTFEEVYCFVKILKNCLEKIN